MDVAEELAQEPERIVHDVDFLEGSTELPPAAGGAAQVLEQLGVVAAARNHLGDELVDLLLVHLE